MTQHWHKTADTLNRGFQIISRHQYKSASSLPTSLPALHKILKRSRLDSYTLAETLEGSLEWRHSTAPTEA